MRETVYNFFRFSFNIHNNTHKDIYKEKKKKQKKNNVAQSNKIK